MTEAAEEFERLANSDNPAEYRQARWYEASEEVWLEVLEQFPASRFSVALNKRLPDVILDILSRDEDRRMRSTIARKNRLPLGVVERLAQDPDECVRRQIARRKQTPPSVLHALLDDPWDEIRDIVGQRLSTTASGPDAERTPPVG